MMLIGTLALTGVGIPHLVGFAGFYSKDAIIEASFAAHTPNNYAFWLLVIAAFMTAFYSWRLIFMTFHGHTRADHHTYEHAHESPLVMLVVLAVLALGSVAAGFAFQHFFIGEGYKEFWGKALFEGEHNHILHAIHEIPNWVGWAPTLAMLGGFALSYVYYVAMPSLPAATARAFRPVYLFLLNKWYFDELYDWLFVRPRSGSAACCGSAATAPSSTGWGLTGLPTACCGPRVASCGCRLAMSTTTHSPC